MRKLACILAALVLALLPIVSLADMVVVSETTLERSPSLNAASNTYIARVDGGYALFDKKGNALTAAYGNMGSKWNGTFLQVVNEDGLNNLGLLNANGGVIMPLQYADIKIESDKWQIGIILTPTEDTNGDYHDRDNKQFNILQADFYFDGALVGSLPREDYADVRFTSTKGNYICIRKSNGGFWLSNTFARVDYPEDAYYTSEYEDRYKKGVFHNPTGQQAFVPGCTLTSDEVLQDIWYNNERNFVDLQGNVIASGIYDSFKFCGGEYGKVAFDRKYGLVNRQGIEVIPLAYDELGGNAEDNTFFAQGYQVALKDGHVYYLDQNGNVTAAVEDFTLTDSDCRGFYDNAPFLVIKNLGKSMVITAKAGLLSESYEDADYPETYQDILAVQKDGLWGCIGLNGETVIPFIFKYTPDISSDGTMVSGRSDDGEYKLYILAKVESTEAVVTAPVDEPAAPAADDGTWICACGQAGNTGKFCPECGAERPADKVVCSGCGYEPAGETPKFCPECGTKF